MKPSTITGPWRSATRSDATGAQTPRRSSPALSPDISETPASAMSATRHGRADSPGRLDDAGRAR